MSLQTLFMVSLTGFRITFRAFIRGGGVLERWLWGYDHDPDSIPSLHKAAHSPGDVMASEGTSIHTHP